MGKEYTEIEPGVQRWTERHMFPSGFCRSAARYSHTSPRTAARTGPGNSGHASTIRCQPASFGVSSCQISVQRASSLAPTSFVDRGLAGSGLGVRFPRLHSVREQPGGGLASTDTTKRTSDATVQVSRACSAIPCDSWTDPELVSSRTTSATGRQSPALS